MVFVKSNGGQLCNKIWSYVSIIAYCNVHLQKLVIIDFYEYKDSFPNLINNSSVDVLSYNRYGRTYKRLVSFLMKSFFSYAFEYDKKPKGIIQVDGWDFRFDTKYLNQDNVVLIKTLFTPSSNIIQKCKSLLDSKRKDFDTIVGVHIRRGDYRQFADGKFYYSDEEFLGFMQRMQLLLAKRVVFLICSNENVNLEAFPDIDFFQIENTNAIEDLYSLSMCDYILGPHSTYTMWSSFYGNTPLKLILDKTESFTLDDFKVFLSD